MSDFTPGSAYSNVTWQGPSATLAESVSYLIDLAGDYIIDLTGGRIVLGAQYDVDGSGDSGTWGAASAVTVTNTPTGAADNATWTVGN